MKNVSTKTKRTGGKRRSAGPSKASLREIPEVDPNSVRVIGRGADGLKKAMEWSRGRRGRPKAGEKAEGSSARSVRLPDRTWAELERLAKVRGVALNALLRDAIAKEIEAA